MKQPIQLTVLGATGSIGTSTLDVVARHPDAYRVFALTAHRQVELMLTQCATFKPAIAVMTDGDAALQLESRLKAEGLPTQVKVGPQALIDVATDERVDAVMAAIVGAAGLPPSLAAAKAGKRLLLANKESIVLGGQLFMDAVREGGGGAHPSRRGEREGHLWLGSRCGAQSAVVRHP